MILLRSCIIALAIASVAVQIATGLSCTYCQSEKQCANNPTMITCPRNYVCFTLKPRNGIPAIKSCAIKNVCTVIGASNDKCSTCNTDYCNKFDNKNMLISS